jgi:Fe-S oxidoreductase
MASCIHCGLCAAHCGFLSGKPAPGRMAEAYETDPAPYRQMAFSCSLCGLCTELCPKHLDLPGMFLAWRQEAVAKKAVDLTPYHGILAYEQKGCSPLFSYYHLPEHCDTVFFPGCTLTGTRPISTMKTYEYLTSRIPRIGMVLDCCTKPSRDLGRNDFFTAMFTEMCTYLTGHGVCRVITACPSCHALFSTQGPFTATSIYELMADHPETLPAVNCRDAGPSGLQAVIQDPCQSRKDRACQKAVRALAKQAGVDQIPLKASGTHTLCCGEGASVGRIHPGLATAWTMKRKKAAGGHTALTYCAGCVSIHGSGAIHLLDLVFDPSGKGNYKAARPPFTYLNRLRVKQKIKALPSAHSRIRRFFYKDKPHRPGSRCLAAGLVLLTVTLLAGWLALGSP